MLPLNTIYNIENRHDDWEPFIDWDYKSSTTKNRNLPIIYKEFIRIT